MQKPKRYHSRGAFFAPVCVNRDSFAISSSSEIKVGKKITSKLINRVGWDCYTEKQIASFCNAFWVSSLPKIYTKLNPDCIPQPFSLIRYADQK